jgi:hypothetical protein
MQAEHFDFVSSAPNVATEMPFRDEVAEDGLIRTRRGNLGTKTKGERGIE